MGEENMRSDCAEQIGEIKAQIRTLFKRTETMDNIKEIATKLSVLMETTINENKKRDKILERQSQALEKINANLTHLNDKNVTFETKIEDIEKRLDFEESKGKIDVQELWKKIFTNTLVGAMSGVVTFGFFVFVYLKFICK